MADRDRSTDKALEDAPTRREYEVMMEGIEKNMEGEIQLQCKFLLVTIGELGLRGGELAHITREWEKHDWIDLVNNRIRIPDWSPCDCSYCHKMAKQEAGYSDITVEESMRERWKPVKDLAVREVPFGYNTAIVELYKRFFHVYDKWPRSRIAVNRRVKGIVEASALDRDPKSLYPDALRCGAGFYHASKSMNPMALAEMMGITPETALKFHRRTNSGVQQELDRIHGEK